MFSLDEIPQGFEIEDYVDQSEEIICPTVGMSFQSENDVRKFYKNFAHSEGFGISKIHGKKDENGRQRFFSLACCRNGKHIPTGKNVFNGRSSMKSGCGARINVSIKDGELFIISKVVLDHNHLLSPLKARHFACHRKIDPFSKRILDVNDQAGIRTSKSFNSLVIKAGGYDCLSYEERDVRNYLATSTIGRLGGGDAQAVCEYFVRMQKRNPNFFHAIDFDDNFRVRNIFWADARSRALYESFSDVISFDSTYLTNKYDMPFAPFVGVNHHGQSVLFGCGLLSNENISTYVWLFKAWLECMSGRMPNAIVTDQCKAIQGAVSQVFPHSRHRLCLWHIMKKIPEKLGSYKSYDVIKKRLKGIVYESLTTEDFDEQWLEMISDHCLNNNVWLSSLFNDRTRWAPVYVKQTFWAGMSTTQRSESMNAFFDDYVNSKTTLKQFVEQYDNALRSKVEKEEKADFHSINSSIPLLSDFPFEKQFQEAYTHDIFRKVQNEIKGLIFCNLVDVTDVGGVRVFIVTDVSNGKDGASRKTAYTVQFDEIRHEFKCVCCLFDFSGIMCRHCIKVLIHTNTMKVSPQYILDRWRKGIKRKHNSVKNCYVDNMSNEQMSRHHELYSKFSVVVEAAVASDEKFKFCSQYMDSLHEALMNFTADSVNCTFACEGTFPDVSVHSPKKVRSKGRPPSKRKAAKVYKPKAKSGKISESNVQDVAEVN